MTDGRLNNYDTAVAHLKGAETDGPQISDDTITATAQYDLAAAQVRALLAVADEMRALRKAVSEGAKGITSAVNGLDSEHSSLRHMVGGLEDIARKG